MDYAHSLALLVGVLVISLVSPGPNFIIVTNTSIAVSRTAGLFAALGLAVASLTWAVMAMVGLGLLLANFEWMHIALRMIGALYLIWLGIKMIRHAGQPLTKAGAAETTWQSAMRRAYIVSMTNPKSVAFYGSIFALVVPVGAPFWFYALTALICLGLSLVWYCSLALFFSNPVVARGFLRFKAAIERIMGAALLLLGGRMLLTR